MKPRIANKDARRYVQRRKEFQGNNTFAEWRAIIGDDSLEGNPQPEDMLYTVYSYGHHWPLFIYSEHLDKWFENSDKHGTTTSKHHTQLHPNEPTQRFNCATMKNIVRYGYVEAVAQKLNPALEMA